MDLVADERGQSIWIGFLLLLGFLMVAFALYQATIVPAQNAAIEHQHAERMEENMHGIRDRVYLLGRTGGTQTVSFDLAPNYPPRLFALNPPSTAGTLRTQSAGTISLRADGSAVNLSRACGYGGTTIRTRSLAYATEYSASGRNTTIAYTQTALYESTGGEQLLLADQQSLVTNHTITLVPITDSYSESGTGTVSLELVAGPVNRTTVSPNESVRLTIPTRLNASQWRTLLAGQSAVSRVEQTGGTQVTIAFEPAHEYTVVCYPVGLERAPPTGVRHLEAAETGVVTTATPTSETPTPTPGTPTPGTPTPTATPGPENAPDPTIRSVNATRERRGSTYHNEVTVDWAASDPDGNLDSVTVRITDMNTSTTKTKTFDVSGGSASGQYTATFGGGRSAQGDTYRVVVLATDAVGNQAREETTVHMD